jgi:Family of unknown function (DUF6922)
MKFLQGTGYNPDMTVPLTLAPFFQEYDVTKLNSRTDSGTIIERTLRYGTRSELKWLFTEFSRSEIREWIQAWGSFSLPAPHLSFWRLALEIE